MITSLSDWFKVLVTFCQPIRSETKTNRGSHVHIFPCFVSAMCNYFEFDWFTGLSPTFLIGHVITLVLVLQHSIENCSIIIIIIMMMMMMIIIIIIIIIIIR